MKEKKPTPEKREQIEIIPGNTDVLIVQLLNTINKNLVTIIKNLEEKNSG